MFPHAKLHQKILFSFSEKFSTADIFHFPKISVRGETYFSTFLNPPRKLVSKSVARGVQMKRQNVNTVIYK